MRYYSKLILVLICISHVEAGASLKKFAIAPAGSSRLRLHRSINLSSQNAINKDFPLPQAMLSHIENSGRLQEDDVFLPSPRTYKAGEIQLSNYRLSSVFRDNAGLTFNWKNKEKNKKNIRFHFDNLIEFNQLWTTQSGNTPLQLNNSNYNNAYNGLQIGFPKLNTKEKMSLLSFLDSQFPNRHSNPAFNTRTHFYEIQINVWGQVVIVLSDELTSLGLMSPGTSSYVIGDVFTYNKKMSSINPSLMIDATILLQFEGSVGFLRKIEEWKRSCASLLSSGQGLSAI